MNKHLYSILAVIIILGGAYYVGHHNASPASLSPTPKQAMQTKTSSAPETSTFNKKQYSLTDPTSLWLIVNKQHPLSPKTYIPADLIVPNVPLRVPGNESMQLRKPTATAVETMFAAAKADNVDLMVSSGYRSYTYQVGLYGGYVSSMGQAAADTQSARPGYSEHQTGLALDIEPTSKKCELSQCFADTPEGQWLVTNAYKYGFILRYTPTDVATTGYESEPWHYRYVGVDLATEMHKDKIATLEQFFGVSGGPNYSN